MDRNFILALALCMLVFLTWEAFVVGPQRVARDSYQQELAAQQANPTGEAIPTSDLGGGITTDAQGNVLMDRETAIAEAPGRVKIETPAFTGSINLKGARIDDLKLKGYREELSKDSPIVTLFSPRETEFGHYIQTGVLTKTADGKTTDGQQDIWNAPEGAVLTPQTPVTLTREENGVEYALTISVDDSFMFTVEQKVSNTSNEPVTIFPYGLSVQRGMPPFLKKFMILHEGPVGVIGTTLKERKYTNAFKKKEILEQGTGGWVGLTSKNWLAALIPDQSLEYTAALGYEQNSTAQKPFFRSLYRAEGQQLAPGDSYSNTSRMFAGAKRVSTLKAYQAPVEKGGLGITDFDKAVDWGNFNFLTRPIFWLLDFFANLTGNYGVAILLMTLVVKALLFPLANKSYVSMANMRKVQPEMTALRERYKDDKMKQQQEMMALYKKHNINPLAGCLPMLVQMPIFYALYKTLFVTIETRHEGFLYIKDLSDRDPAMLFNLFGLLPYDPSAVPVVGAIIGIGLLPLLMGAAMWVQMKLNPPPPDPMQAQIFAFMPLIFMFIFAPFAAGLVLYWFWNTFLGVLQQYYIMRRNGTDVDLFGNIKKSFQRKPKTANENNSAE